nr:type III-B CRISPR module RAMP protein Cmr6 [Thermococcus sp. MAR1]
MHTKTRLVVGLGDESVYETSIRLLRNYGVPYIPGSALKGIARSYAIEKLVEAVGSQKVFSTLRRITENIEKRYLKEYPKEKTEFNRDFYGAMEVLSEALSINDEDLKKILKEKLGDFLSWEIRVKGEKEKGEIKITVKELRKIFGTVGKEGKVVFLDALPLPPRFEDWDIFEWDIMNPHYGPYYQDEKPPGDWYSPKPIKFLTVKEKTKFLFGLRKSTTCHGGCKVLVKKAEPLLREALKHHGVGAKTSLGYGRF